MKVLIIDSSNKRETFEINQNSKIKELVEKIEKKKGINQKIVLHFNGDILDEEEIISNYDIEENSAIIFIGQFRGGI